MRDFANNMKAQGYALISMFALEMEGAYYMRLIFADRSNSELIDEMFPIESPENTYDTIADIYPIAAFYEREIKDLFGLEALGNPNLKPMVFHYDWPDTCHPLRKEYPVDKRPEKEYRDIAFAKVDGDGVYEIPVGPVHAGIIEPGHFRFSVIGEPIINLEAQLYYVHKGIEKLAEKRTIFDGLLLAERISGDESFTNALAYCLAAEHIANASVPYRASQSRVIFAELERLTAHLGDLGGICLDVAFGFATFQFRMMRGWTYWLVDELCGSRFLRNILLPGGIRQDFIKGKEERIREYMEKIQKELHETEKIIKARSLFVDRIENIGVLTEEVVMDFNVSGPPARGCGKEHDVRKDFPYCAYSDVDFDIPTFENGDVESRMNVKIYECYQSIHIILKTLDQMEDGLIRTEIHHYPTFTCGIGMTESPRGENVHFLMSGEHNDIYRYKVRTPSFCNWPALLQAVSGNIVPDFPLINKSFNLSYAGNDL